MTPRRRTNVNQKSRFLEDPKVAAQKRHDAATQLQAAERGRMVREMEELIEERGTAAQKAAAAAKRVPGEGAGQEGEAVGDGQVEGGEREMRGMPRLLAAAAAAAALLPSACAGIGERKL